MNDPDEKGAFGDADGARAEIDDIMRGFVEFGATSPAHLRIDRNDLRQRVIVGGKGAGKSVYLRRLQALASHQGGEIYSDRDSLYADDVRQDVPTSASVVQVSHWFKHSDLTESWKWLWRRAILRSLVSHLLNAKRLRAYVDKDAQEELRAYEEILYRHFTKPLSVYSQMREMISAHRIGHELQEYVDHHLWNDLEVTLSEVLRVCPPICFYVDAIDDEFAHAPMYWLECQKGLFYEIMRLLREPVFGNRLHVIICVRDIVFSSMIRSEHADRYRDSTHIRLLDWDDETLRFFLVRKLATLDRRYIVGDVTGESPTVAEWLGVERIKNTRRENRNEPIEEYLLRHIRPLPRDIVRLGNKLCRGADEVRGAGATELSPLWIKGVVSEAAKQFGDVQLTVCANQISADTMPAHASQHGYAPVYTGEAAYAPVASRHLKDFLRTIVGRDRFDNSFRRGVAEQAAREFNGKTDVLSVLWQNGLLGYGEGDLHAGEVTFYSLNGRSEELLLPEDRDFYALHSCLIDAAEVEPIGDPVYPHRRRMSAIRPPQLDEAP